MKYIFQDWKSNSTKGRLILILFRLANLGTENKIVRVLGVPYRWFYTFFVEWILGIELQWKTKVGRGLRLYHGQGLVVNGESILGKNCSLRQCTTIGNKMLSDGTYSASPIIGDNVDIGSNVCIIGNVEIGDNVQIGSGTIIVDNVPSNSLVVGNPARIINKSII